MKFFKIWALREVRDFRDSRDSSSEKTPFVLTPVFPVPTWSNENLSFGFQSILGIAPGVAPRILVFALHKS